MKDILSFAKIGVQLGMLEADYVLQKSRHFVQTIINDQPYAEIIEPYLREAAHNAGYGYKRDGFIYALSGELYENLVAEEHEEKTAELMYVTYVYDLCSPLIVSVQETDDEIIWSADCDYHRWWEKWELPIFRFDKVQYATAIAELKAIVDEQSSLPSKEAMENTVFDGTMRNGNPDGYGTLIWPDGTKHTGIWKDGARIGEFVYTDENGHTRKEIWAYNDIYSSNMLVEIPP